jgi:hypothetical protein
MSWKIEDHLKYFVTLKYPEYMKISELIKNYKVPLGAVFALLGSQKYEMGKIFKQGKAVVSESIESFLRDTHDFFTKCINSSSNNRKLLFRRDFITALFWFYRKFPKSFQRMIGKVENTLIEFPLQSPRVAYEKLFILNYNKVKPKGEKGLVHPFSEKRRSDEDFNVELK